MGITMLSTAFARWRRQMKALYPLKAIPLLGITLATFALYFVTVDKAEIWLRPSHPTILPVTHLMRWAPLLFILALHVFLARANDLHVEPDPLLAPLLRMLVSPLMLLPTFVGLIRIYGNYSGNDIGHLQSIPVALQGSGDWGGSNLYAVCGAAMLWFGMTGAIYLDLRLREIPDHMGFLPRLAKALWILKFHILAFVPVWTPVCAGWNEAALYEQDFRNVIVLAFLTYTLSILLAVAFSRRKSRLSRALLSPILLILVAFLSSDGTSHKAGHVPCGTYCEHPGMPPRGARHAFILAWHRFCYRILPEHPEQER